MKKTNDFKVVTVMEKMQYKDVPVGARFVECTYYFDIEEDYGTDVYIQRDFNGDERIIPNMIKFEDYSEYLCSYPYVAHEAIPDDVWVYAEIKHF